MSANWRFGLSAMVHMEGIQCPKVYTCQSLSNQLTSAYWVWTLLGFCFIIKLVEPLCLIFMLQLFLFVLHLIESIVCPWHSVLPNVWPLFSHIFDSVYVILGVAMFYQFSSSSSLVYTWHCMFAFVWVLLDERTNRSLKKKRQLLGDHIFGSFVYDVEIENQKTNAVSCLEHCKEPKRGKEHVDVALYFSTFEYNSHFQWGGVGMRIPPCMKKAMDQRWHAQDLCRMDMPKWTLRAHFCSHVARKNWPPFCSENFHVWSAKMS